MSNRIVKAVIKEVATPIILKLLEPYTAEDLQRAINSKLDLVKAIEANGDFKVYFLGLFMLFPGMEKVKEYLNEKWLNYFIENELKTARPDLYLVLQNNNEAKQWLVENIKNICEAYFTT